MPKPCDFIGVRPADVAAAVQNLPGVGAVLAGQELEERRLAGTVRADDAAQLALVEGEVHRIDGDDTTEALVHAPGLEERSAHRGPASRPRRRPSADRAELANGTIPCGTNETKTISTAPSTR